ncbi:MAG: hypothetical protein HQL15_01425 [Candidatus Omnitrophica bacterium]|nr:hypothetical protein [Candidatus Omnitrophota bacterium]
MNFSQQPLETKKKIDLQSEALRTELAEYAKDFKVSWVHLGQGLYSVYRDKLFHAWGFEKFEDYVIRELGLKKPMALKLVKTYFFVEQEEPAYLKKEFSETREALVVPGHESLDVLRLARRRNELTRDDYAKLRKDVFEKGKDAAVVKKDLTAMIKERKQVDPDEEREKRSQASIKKFFTALKNFKNDMDTLRLVEADILEETETLLRKLEEKYL